MGLMGYKSPQPKKVTDRFYSVLCEKCGWEGSSEQCGVVCYHDDSDITCGSCSEIIAGDGSPNWNEKTGWNRVRTGNGK